MMPLASYRFADRFYLCSVTTSNFLRGPRWQSDSAEPPLSPGSALAIAERHASRLVPGVWKFKPQEIVLKNFAGVWFYIVELEALDETAYRYGGKMAPIKIPVLMDGTVAQTIDQGEVRDPVGANRLRLKPDQ